MEKRAYKVGSPEKAFIAWNAPYSIGYYLFKGELGGLEKSLKPQRMSNLML